MESFVAGIVMGISVTLFALMISYVLMHDWTIRRRKK